MMPAVTQAHGMGVLCLTVGLSAGRISLELRSRVKAQSPESGGAFSVGTSDFERPVELGGMVSSWAVKSYSLSVGVWVLLECHHAPRGWQWEGNVGLLMGESHDRDRWRKCVRQGQAASQPLLGWAGPSCSCGFQPPGSQSQGPSGQG